jgi:hypothetical protein
MWTNPSGNVMILLFTTRSPGNVGQPFYMVLRNGELTPIPGSHSIVFERAW